MIYQIQINFVSCWYLIGCVSRTSIFTRERIHLKSILKGVTLLGVNSGPESENGSPFLTLSDVT